MAVEVFKARDALFIDIITAHPFSFIISDTAGIRDTEDIIEKIGVEKSLKILEEMDLVLYLINAEEGVTKEDFEILSKIQNKGLKYIPVINKIDLLPDKSRLLPIIAAYSDLYGFSAVVPVSAADGSGIEELKSELKKFAAESIHYFGDDELTDQSERTLSAEIIREKLLRFLDKEVPHGIAVGIEKFKDRQTSAGEDIIDIEAIIYCESESHKGIIIGKKGAMLKKISTLARQDIEAFFGCKVALTCWVKVKEDWRNRQGLIHNFGLD